jgi:hypothetical protein
MHICPSCGQHYYWMAIASMPFIGPALEWICCKLRARFHGRVSRRKTTG